MAIKAKAEITVYRVVEVAAVTRYYLLQSSTLSKPSKPTAYPPASPWSVTEPSYTAGSTNSLYFVEVTVLTDGAWAYSDVSLSSSYEAAKAAFNKAQAAENSAAAAAKTATNYMSYDTTNGLQVGNKESGSWSGFRTQITASAFNVLNAAGTVLASYGANLIELGKNSVNAVIKLCGGKGTIQSENDTTLDGETVNYLSFKSDNLRLFGTNGADIWSADSTTHSDHISWGKSWVKTIASGSGSARVEMYAESCTNADLEGVGAVESSYLDVDALSIYGYTGNINLGAKYGVGIGAVSGDVNLDASAGDVNITTSGTVATNALIKSSKTHNAFLVEHGEDADAYYTASRTDTGTTVRFGIGSGGTNHGVYSSTQSRWLINGNASGDIFIGGGYAYGAYVLYNNASGNAGTVTLSDSLANYEYVDIFFVDNNGSEYGCQRIYSPNSKGPHLALIEASNTTTTYIRRTAYSLSGTTMTPRTEYAGYHQLTTSSLSYKTGSNFLKIVRVVGYK